MFEQAKWIWSAADRQINDYADFIRTFSARAGQGILRISADSEYCVKLNGAFVGCGQYGDYRAYKVYDEYAVVLLEGENTLEIGAYYMGEDFSTYRVGGPGVLFELSQGEMIVASDEKTLARRNAAYKCGPIEKITVQLAFSFAYDACAEAGEWENALVVDGAEKLYPRPIKKLDILSEAPGEVLAAGCWQDALPEGTPAQRMQKAWMQYMQPKRVQLPDEKGYTVQGEGDVYVIIDLFREETGLFTMDIEVDEPCEILIGWGEHLDDMRLRTSISGRNFGARYMAQAGRQTFTHHFRRLGLRYVQLFARAKKLTVHYAGLLPTPYPLGDMELATSDRLHDEIARVSARTLLLCMHEHYEDCPWREQALYTMDSRNQILCGYYAFGEYAMPKASLRVMGLSLREDNKLELCAPAVVPITIPSFVAMYLVEIQEYLLFSGDMDFGREMLDVCRRIADGFLTDLDENGLMARYEDPKYWNFYEWREYLEGYVRMECDKGWREDAPLCAFVSMGLKAFGDTLAMLGEDGSRYARAAEELAQRAHKAFWNEREGAYASFRGQAGLFHYAELTQALMLLCGAVPEENQAQVRARLSEGRDLVPATTSYTLFKFDALMQDPAYACRVLDEVTRDWGKMLCAGATAFWETMDGARDFNDAGSLCHGWSAVPLYLYFRYALGLYPTKPGFEEYTVEPVDCGLIAPRGTVTTRDGRRICLHAGK